MTILKIVTVPDSILRKKCSPVTSFDKKLKTLLDDMYETMLDAPGVGLAAPQVGVDLNVTVIDIEDGKNRFNLVNPEIIFREGVQKSSEGCLSIPDFKETIDRAEKVVVKAFDEKGKEFIIEGTGLLSACLQHEIDHLNGILFTDYLSKFKIKYLKKWCIRNKIIEPI